MVGGRIAGWAINASAVLATRQYIPGMKDRGRIEKILAVFEIEHRKCKMGVFLTGFQETITLRFLARKREEKFPCFWMLGPAAASSAVSSEVKGKCAFLRFAASTMAQETLVPVVQAANAFQL